MVPARIAAITPPEPSAISRRSGSSPTQLNTISAPCAAAAGVAADLPWYCVHQRSAFAAVRLYTVTAWPFFASQPAIGKPMTPNPKNATFAIVFYSCRK